MIHFLTDFLLTLQRILAALQGIRAELREILTLIEEIEAHQHKPSVRFEIGTAEPK